MRILILLAGCAVAAAPVLIEGVPHVRQKPDFCGEACVAMYLQKLGHDVDQDFVFDQSGLAATHARGCYSKELKLALARIGFETGPGWAAVRPRTPRRSSRRNSRMLRDLRADIPSIVCMHYDDSPNASEHFRLILGYDAAAEELIYHEPAEDDAAYQRMPKERFLSRWPLKYKADAWTVIRFPLRAGQIRARPSKARYSDADFAQHLMQLKTRTPAGFSAALEKPFVVVGDIGAAAVQRRAEGTVRWVVERVKHLYFEKDPNEIIDIWLFRDRASYEKHCWDLFQTIPTTPFGFYSASDNALIMNIATGGGTLVHEMIHPFIEANFPSCPSWVGLALRAVRECARIYSWAHELALGRPAGGDTRQDRPELQITVQHKPPSVLRIGPGYELLAGPLSLLLSARTRPAAKVLSRVPEQQDR